MPLNQIYNIPKTVILITHVTVELSWKYHINATSILLHLRLTQILVLYYCRVYWKENRIRKLSVNAHPALQQHHLCDTKRIMSRCIHFLHLGGTTQFPFVKHSVVWHQPRGKKWNLAHIWPISANFQGKSKILGKAWRKNMNFGVIWSSSQLRHSVPKNENLNLPWGSIIRN